MLNDDDFLALTVKNIILESFPHAGIEIVFDEERNEYFLSTPDEKLYDSEAYGKLIFEINQNILWKTGKFNFYFTRNLRGSEFNEIAKKATFLYINENICKSWGVSESFFSVDNRIDAFDFSLAA